MLKIRKQQMEALNQRMAVDFENSVYIHLLDTYPAIVQRESEQVVRKSIKTGIEQAANYAITAEYDVVRFIDLMYLLSHDFDSNPKTAWVRPILDDPQIPPGEKMDLIHEKA